MELIEEAREALRDSEGLVHAPMPSAPPRFASTAAAGRALVHRKSLELFCEAIFSAAPFEAEKSFLHQREQHQAATAAITDAMAGVDGQRRQILALTESISRANDVALTRRLELGRAADELSAVRGCTSSH